MKPGKSLGILVFCLFVISCASPQAKIEQDKANDFQNEYERALVAMRYDLVDESIKYLKNALSLAPNHHHSRYLLGMAYMKKEDYKEAAAAFEKCLELKPDDSETHTRLGDVYRHMGLQEKAGEEYKKAHAIDNSSVASFNLAMLYYGQNKLEQALDYVQKSIQEGNNSVEAYNLQGVILNQQKKYSEAIASFSHALRIDPKHAVTAINLAVAYINNNETDRAREILVRILPHVQEQELKDKINEYLEKIKKLKE
jgi:tetratricopeptide (TPR) repeat protein